MDLPTPSGVPTIFGPGQAPQAVKHGAKPHVAPAQDGSGPAQRAQRAQREPEAPKASPAESPEASTSSKGAYEAHEGTASAWTSAEELLQEGMPAIGSVVRVSGLKSLPELNGTLAEVVRPAASQRVVVQTCVGEKALRRSNLDETLHALLPPWAAPVGAALVLGTLVAPVAGKPLGAALLPMLALGWAGSTLALCLSIYRCCWHGWCLPSFSSVCGRKPNRTLLRLGFLVAGILLFTSNWLYGELVVPQILDGPIQEEEVSPVPEVAHESEDASGNAWDNASLDNASLNNATENATEDATENATENATKNATVVKRPRIPSPAMIQGSLLYGYIAAFTFSLVGLCFCDGRWWTTLIHVMLGIIFTFAGWQHTWTSSSLLTSARGRRYAESMGELYSIAKFRQMISDFAPLVALAVPITAQVLCQSRITQRRGTLSTMGFLETSGILLSMKALQWGLMLTYLIFVGSYAVDFWVLSQLPPDEELI